MTFPTIPTSNRVRFINQADTSTTRTFDAFANLTYSSGDLIIAVVTAYQSGGSSGAVFSGWSNGFTECSDQMTTSGSTMAIGVAYKWTSGSETGSLSVTQASPTGHASMALIAISGAHSSTAPEVGTIADGTSAAADPGSFDPSGWAAEDTLWISINCNGMTSGTGSWTGTVATAPTNYTSRQDSNTTDNSTTGQTEIAVAFRQLNASSENVGPGSTDTSNARNSALIIAVRPAPTLNQYSFNAEPRTFTGTYSATQRLLTRVNTAGSFTGSYQAATLSKARALTFNAEPGALTGTYNATQRLLTRVSAARAFTGSYNDATLFKIRQISFNAEPRAFAGTYSDATLTKTRALSCNAEPGAFTGTYFNANLSKLRSIAFNAEVGAFTGTYFNATLDWPKHIHADLQAFSLTGFDAFGYVDTPHIQFSAEPASFALSGYAATLTYLRALSLNAEPYAATLTGFMAELLYEQPGAAVFNAEPTAFLLTPADAELVYGALNAYVLQAMAGALTATGYPIAVTRSGLFPDMFDMLVFTRTFTPDVTVRAADTPGSVVAFTRPDEVYTRPKRS